MPDGGGKVGTSFVEVAPKVASNFKSVIEGAVPDGAASGRRFGGGFSGGMRSAVSAGAVAVGNLMADVARRGAGAARGIVEGALQGFSDFQQLGRFTLRDGGQSVAFGKITKLVETVEKLEVQK